VTFAPCHSGLDPESRKYQAWIPAPRFRGDKFTPAKAGAGMRRSDIFFLETVLHVQTEMFIKRAIRWLKYHWNGPSPKGVSPIAGTLNVE